MIETKRHLDPFKMSAAAPKSGSNTPEPFAAEPMEFLDLYLKLSTNWDATGPSSELLKLVCTVLGSRGPAQNFESLKGGITNQLIMFSDKHGRKYLLRAFGKGTDSFIDRQREYATHLQLTTLNLAPQLLCRFGNGLIYEYLEGRTLEYPELSDPEIVVGVSNRLAQWHTQLHIKDVEDRLPSHKSGDIWQLLQGWIEIVPAGVLPMSQNELKQELAWLRENLEPRGGPKVMGHCDLLSGNIVTPNDWTSKVHADEASEDFALRISEPYEPSTLVTFIDYEYALPCPRAYDIANHFQEWQGFDCNKALVPYPSNASHKLVAWTRHYLRAYQQFSGRSEVQDEQELISELAAWWGMPGFYWGLWSAIQHSTSEIDFDYFNYAKSRFAEYTSWKSKIWPTLQ